MKLIVDIPDEIYESTSQCGVIDTFDKIPIGFAIKNGTPLPEHHGRIIDESKIHTVYEHTKEHINSDIKYIRTRITHTDAPTIIEANRGSDSK